MSRKKPLYEKIVEDFKEKILSGEYVLDDKLPTELDLAEMYEVSRITSKRALEELKALGLIYRIRGSGSFVALQDSRNLAVSKENQSSIKPMIAIIMPLHVTESSFAKSINGAIEVFDKCGYYSIVYSGLKNSEDERRIIQRLYDDGIQGIIYYPVSDRDNYKLLNTLHLNDYPIVTIDKYFEGLSISNVIADSFDGSYKVTKHLIEFGHEKIGFVSDLSIESATSIRDRYFGYAKALKDSGKDSDERYVRTGFTDEYHRDYSNKEYTSIIKELLKLGVTGVIGVNDLVATFLLRAAIELEVRIPEELSITGFDDLEMVKHLQVPLTTIHQNFNEIGRQAAKLIIQSIETNKYQYQQIVLPVELIIRESSTISPPRGS